MHHNLDSKISEAISQFREIYLNGIPLIIQDRSAFLAFVCILTGIEALSGYRYPNINKINKRFKNFIQDYFESQYHSLQNPLWKFRNKMVHAFCPSDFALCHHNSNWHMRKTKENQTVLNAEDFFQSFNDAAEKYFKELEGTSALQSLMIDRLNNLKDGGGIAVFATTLGDTSS